MVEKNNKDTPQEEENKSENKLVDQSKSNLPLDVEKEDLIAMLEENLKPLNLLGEEANILRNGLLEGKFNKAAKIVHHMLRMRRQHETATIVEEMGPLYDPHDFWDNQPVPKTGEKLNEEDYN